MIKFTIAVNHHEYAKGLYDTYEEAVKVAARSARDENAPEWDGLDDEEVYDYQDGYYHVMEIEVDENEVN